METIIQVKDCFIQYENVYKKIEQYSYIQFIGRYSHVALTKQMVVKSMQKRQTKKLFIKFNSKKIKNCISFVRKTQPKEYWILLL